MGKKRPAHLITVPKGKTHPEHVIFVDTETSQHKGKDKDIIHELTLGVAIYHRFRRDGYQDNEKVYRFKTEEEFWGIVANYIKPKNILYLMSHNAVFDFVVLKHVTHLEKLGYTCLFMFQNGTSFLSKFRHKKHTIEILNTGNWFKGTVKKWGKELELEKMRMPKSDTPTEKLFAYCERDCRIIADLFTWYLTFLKIHNLGSWKITLPSQAFYAFRYRFMRHKINVPDDEQETKLARESYHGGRTECFRVGKYGGETFYKLDVNSMYPYVMKEYEYPVSLESVVDSPSNAVIEHTLKRKGIIADVELNTTIPYFVARSNERNVYPVGHFRTVLTTAEFNLAWKNRWVERVHSAAIYQTRRVFASYVDFFYGLKQEYTEEGKTLLRSFTKLYLNSLYGKFGQRMFNDRKIGESDESLFRISYGYNMRTKARCIVRQVGKSVFYVEKDGEGYNSFTAIASHVTGYARLLLYDLVIRAERSNVFYCDTDSIIVNERGKDNLESLMHPTRLGYLKVEGESDVLEICAPKHYYFDGHWTRKGIRHNAVKLGDNKFRQEIWPGYNSILRSEQEVYFNYFQDKSVVPMVQSGILQRSGMVNPFVLERCAYDDQPLD